MNYRRMLRGARFWFWVVLFVAYGAGAVGILIVDTMEERYRDLPKVQLTSVKSEKDVRRASAAEVAAIYRAQSGMPFATLQPGSTFQVVWPDGSTETVMVVSPTSTLGIEPMAGSQQDAPLP
ncbi:MAG: hypothetical protein ABW178_10445 [Pseudoxanthomonas sp.]